MIRGNLAEIRCVYLIAGLISLLLSFWGSSAYQPVNPDGICYLESAAAFATHGLQSAMHLCEQARWPFYSMLLALGAKLTSLSYYHFAVLINSAFSVITALSFIYIVQILEGPRKVIIFSAAVMLFFPTFNSLRDAVVRDHGFWAFYLLSVVFLLRYFKNKRITDSLLWAGMLVAATLFRVEGAIFLFLLPWCVWFNSELCLKQRLKAFLQLNSMLLVGGIALLAYGSISKVKSIPTGRIEEVIFFLLHGVNQLSQQFHLTAEALKQHVLSPYAMDDARILLCLFLISWYLVKVVLNTSILYSGLALFAMSKRLFKTSYSARLVLASYFAVNILITGAYLINYRFLSKRYLMALSLLLMLWVPYGLAALWERGKKTVRLSIIILLSLPVLAYLTPMGTSKAYIREAGEWLANHTPATANIYSNDKQIMYYSKHFGGEIFTKEQIYLDPKSIAGDNWKHYDFLAIRQNNHQTIRSLPTSVVRVFQNKRGDKVVIYKVGREE